MLQTSNKAVFNLFFIKYCLGVDCKECIWCIKGCIHPNKPKLRRLKASESEQNKHLLSAI